MGGVRRNSPVHLLMEPVPIADTFATGVMPIEIGSGFVRLVFYADRAVVMQDEDFYPVAGRERIVIARMVIPAKLWPRVMQTIIQPFRNGEENGNGDNRRSAN